VLASAGEVVFGVMTIDLAPDDGRIRSIYAILNPDKLTRIPARRSSALTGH
jgi:hypothetical protein